MWALVGNAEFAFANQRLKGFRDSSRFQHAHGSAHSQENSPIWCRWWRSFRMLHQRAQDLIGQRQFQRRGDLALVDSQDALSPMEYAAGDRIQQPEARQQAPEPLRLPPPLSQLPGDLAKDDFGQKGSDFIGVMGITPGALGERSALGLLTSCYVTHFLMMLRKRVRLIW